MAYIYDMAATWAAAGTTFTAIKMNVTDTASAAGSLLMDLQVGGSSRFNVDKTGSITIGGTVDGYILGRSGQVLSAQQFYNALRFGITEVLRINATSAVFAATSQTFGWTDTVLARDAANTLAQRNGVNAQAFRVYNTFTDASNYERGVASWGVVGNFLTIGTQNAGTGTARGLIITAANNDLRLYNTGLTNGLQFSGEVLAPLPTSGNYHLGSANTNWKALYMGERASAPTTPPTNGVVVYAEDNGAGKTRLMALFATGAAVQIAIEP